nr:hypothetical protein [Haliscomenobacter sp.]
MGAVYCNNTALAAVVILVATTKQVARAVYSNPTSTTIGVSVSARRRNTAKKVRAANTDR